MLTRFTAKEVAALIALSTVCLVVLFAIVVAAFRPLESEGRQAVYQLASSLIGLAAGLLGGGTAGYIAGKAAGKPEEGEEGEGAKNA